jgi:tetratricopeptide (TPR) repeat protein
VLAYRQTMVWRDTETLWTHALGIDARSSIAYTNRAWDRQQRDDLAGAMADLDKAVESDPHDAAAYNARGALRWRMGDGDGAADDFRHGLEVAKPTTRWYGYLKTNLANLEKAMREAERVSGLGSEPVEAAP